MHYPDKQEELQQKEDFNIDEYNEKIRAQVSSTECTNSAIFMITPKAQKYLHTFRALKEEMDNTHGTHVSGLMTYDRPDFGLIPYRILPYYESKEDKELSKQGIKDRFIEDLRDSFADAEKKGVKIINLSLGGGFEKPVDGSKDEDIEDFQKYLHMIKDDLEQIIKSHPSMLFIAAAGNDGTWSDGSARVQYPCGLSAENILCVGSLNKKDQLSSFTNIPLNNVDLVFMLGENVISTLPSDLCPELVDLQSSLLPKLGTSSNESQESQANDPEKLAPLCVMNPDKSFSQNFINMLAAKEKITQTVNKCMKNKALYGRMTGTSMASPLVAHLAGEIWVKNLKMTPVEVIQKIKNSATRQAFGPLMVDKLKVKKPSWYADFEAAPMILSGNSKKKSSGLILSDDTSRSLEEDNNFFEIIVNK